MDESIKHYALSVDVLWKLDASHSLAANLSRWTLAVLQLKIPLANLFQHYDLDDQ